MNRFAKAASFVVAGILALSSATSAAIIVDKTPDVGPFWHPLDGTPNGTYVYTNSFVFTGATGMLMDTVGIYLRNEDLNSAGTPFRFEVYADNANAPNPLSVLAVSGYMQVANNSLALVTNSLTTSVSLVNGVRYWIGASVVGQASQGSYQVGGHTQNSIYPDNGTFWYSNDPNGINFDGQNGNPEMGIYASGNAPEVPEPGSLILFALGAVGVARSAGRKRHAAA